MMAEGSPEDGLLHRNAASRVYVLRKGSGRVPGIVYGHSVALENRLQLCKILGLSQREHRQHPGLLW